jgi:hypothetical protein
MLLVGNRGTRVIPNSQITQMGMQTRGGGNFNIPAPQIIPIINASGLSVMVKYGDQMRVNKVIG